MKLVKIERGRASGEGVLDGDDVRIIGGWHPGPAERAPFSLGGKSREELERLVRKSSESVPLKSISLAVPIDPMAQIFCVGFNYRAHVAETSADEPKEPVLFKRTFDTLVPHGQPIIRPKASVTLDYEGEIAIVIGRQCRHVPVENALSCVSGYSCFMDGSVREYQKHSVTAGKNFWHTGSMGPWVVTPDEVTASDPTLQTFVNGQERQSATVSRMIFGIAQIVAYCSIVTQLRPGDVIATGTPAGVGSRMTPPSWLEPGETVEVAIEGIGRLTNTVKDEVADG
jgi:2-keto-4-pentenoate hydratase/2-oxohepta-3-ene-1,7-dioic acid hydratase in catechol pathway